MESNKHQPSSEWCAAKHITTPNAIFQRWFKGVLTNILQSDLFRFTMAAIHSPGQQFLAVFMVLRL